MACPSMSLSWPSVTPTTWLPHAGGPLLFQLDQSVPPQRIASPAHAQIDRSDENGLGDRRGVTHVAANQTVRLAACAVS